MTKLETSKSGGGQSRRKSGSLFPYIVIPSDTGLRMRGGEIGALGTQTCVRWLKSASERNFVVYFSLFTVRKTGTDT